MHDALKAELKRQAEKRVEPCGPAALYEDRGNDLVFYEGVIDLRFLAGCLEDQFYDQLMCRLRGRG